jgi:phage terminase Nu1 subunit (DNA packaging protein)
LPAIVNSAAVAEALNLTERRVEQLVHEGMPRISRGKYDVWTCAKWYVRYLQKAIERRATENGDETKSNLTEEKKRLIRIQADIAQIDYRKKMGELIPAHLVDDRFMAFASTIHDRFIALPSRVASRLEGESKDVIRVKLYEAVRDLLNGLSADLSGKKSGNSDRKHRGGKRKAAKVNRAGSRTTRRRS